MIVAPTTINNIKRELYDYDFNTRTNTTKQTNKKRLPKRTLFC